MVTSTMVLTSPERLRETMEIINRRSMLRKTFPHCFTKTTHKQREEDRGYLDCGTNLRGGWLTEAGKDVLMSLRSEAAHDQ